MLSWVVAAFAGVGLHHFRVKGRPEAGILGDVLINALLIWFLCWKLSLLVFDPSAIRGGWLGLLYFHGGTRGAWLAAALTAVYLVYAVRKHSIANEKMVDSLLVFLLGGYTARMLIQMITGEGSRLTLGLIVLLGAGVLFRWFYRSVPVRTSSVLQMILLFAVGHAFITTLANNLWEKAEYTAAAATVGLKVGQQAPDFELKDSSGQIIRLSDLREKTVVLNFWATWCPPCRAEMPEMQQFYTAYKDREVTILAVNATNTESSPDAVKQWLEKGGFTFPVTFDNNGGVAQAYRVTAFPATYIIRPGGFIHKKHQGPMNETMLKEAIR